MIGREETSRGGKISPLENGSWLQQIEGQQLGRSSHTGGRSMQSRGVRRSSCRRGRAGGPRRAGRRRGGGQPDGRRRDGGRPDGRRRAAMAEEVGRGRDWRPADGDEEAATGEDEGAALDPRRADLRRPDPRRAATAAAGGRQRPPPAAGSATGGWLDGRRAAERTTAALLPQRATMEGIAAAAATTQRGEKMDLGLEEMLAPRSRLMLPGAAQGRWWCLRDLRFQP